MINLLVNTFLNVYWNCVVCPGSLNMIKAHGVDFKKANKTFTFKFIIIPTFIFKFPWVYLNRITMKKHLENPHPQTINPLTSSINSELSRRILKREQDLSKIFLDTKYHRVSTQNATSKL